MTTKNNPLQIDVDRVESNWWVHSVLTPWDHVGE